MNRIAKYLLLHKCAMQQRFAEYTPFWEQSKADLPDIHPEQRDGNNVKSTIPVSNSGYSSSSFGTTITDVNRIAHTLPPRLIIRAMDSIANTNQEPDVASASYKYNQSFNSEADEDQTLVFRSTEHTRNTLKHNNLEQYSIGDDKAFARAISLLSPEHKDILKKYMKYEGGGTIDRDGYKYLRALLYAAAHTNALEQAQHNQKVNNLVSTYAKDNIQHDINVAISTAEERLGRGQELTKEQEKQIAQQARRESIVKFTKQYRNFVNDNCTFDIKKPWDEIFTEFAAKRGITPKQACINIFELYFYKGIALPKISGIKDDLCPLYSTKCNQAIDEYVADTKNGFKKDFIKVNGSQGEQLYKELAKDGKKLFHRAAWYHFLKSLKPALAQVENTYDNYKELIHDYGYDLGTTNSADIEKHLKNVLKQLQQKDVDFSIAETSIDQYKTKYPNQSESGGEVEADIDNIIKGIKNEVIPAIKKNMQSIATQVLNKAVIDEDIMPQASPVRSWRETFKNNIGDLVASDNFEKWISDSGNANKYIAALTQLQIDAGDMFKPIIEKAYEIRKANAVTTQYKNELNTKINQTGDNDVEREKLLAIRDKLTTYSNNTSKDRNNQINPICIAWTHHAQDIESIAQLDKGEFELYADDPNSPEATDRKISLNQMRGMTVAFAKAINTYGEEVDKLIIRPVNGSLTKSQYDINKLLVPDVRIVVTHGVDKCKEIINKLNNAELEDYTNKRWYQDMRNIYLEQCGGALRL